MDDRYDGYTVEVFLDEDGDWLTRFEELPQISAFAASPEEALAELKIAWEGVRKSYRERHEEVPLAPRVLPPLEMGADAALGTHGRHQ